MGRIYIALDTEATGLRAEADEVIEIGAVKFRDGQILDQWQSFIRPTQSIPYKITALTGITWNDVRRAPALQVAAPALARFVGDYPIVGHSIEIDLALLKRQGVPLRNRAYDTFELATLLLPEVTVYSLAGVAAALAVPVPTQHRAVADAEMAMHVFNALVRRLEELPVEVLAEITRATAAADWPLRPLFQDVEHDLVRTAFARPLAGEGALAGKLAAAGFSQTEFDLGLIRPPALPEPLEIADAAAAPLDLAALGSVLAPGGAAEAVLPGFEHRPEQIAMLGAVGRAFNAGGNLVVEAGTGTGKSLAYLLPALQFAVQNNTRVVVATHTINLQDQLFLKDLPAVQRLLGEAHGPAPAEGDGAEPEPPRRPARAARKAAHAAAEGGEEEAAPFRPAVLKGRANYLCLRRWGNFRKHPPQNLDELRTLVKVLIWLPRTGTGDRAELLLVNGEPQAWSQIAVSEEGCPLHECIHNQKGLCFFYRARRLAEAAHVVVVNHALLLADIATENRVLPPFQHLIIDEAHHLEDGATDQLGYTVGQSVVPDLLGQLSRPRGDRRDGLLADLQRLLTASGGAADLPLTAADRARVQALVGQMQAAADRAVASNQELFAALHRILDAGSEERNEYDKRLRLTSPVRKNPLWGEVQLAWDNLDLLLTGLLDDLTRLTAPLEDLDLAQSDALEYLVPELLSLWHNLAQAQSRLQAALAHPSSGAVYWLSSNARDETTTLHCAPLHVGELLDRYLFQTKRTTVLTSATLSTDGDFAYVRERLGLQTAEELHLGSPYDYVNSTLLYVPSDLPEPNQPGYQRQLEQTLIELCRATRGRALVLFTSHSALRTTYRAIQRPLEESGLLLLGHNLDGSRRQLLERFRSTDGCVLMGTSSFWEGIDVAGEALSVLVIAKLPFRVPSDPVFAARSEQFDDPFAQYSLPQAILRFKQGFGRLIRTRRDRGIVAILDSRVVTKRYGATFLHSLPDCTLRTGSARNLGTQAEEWLARRPLA